MGPRAWEEGGEIGGDGECGGQAVGDEPCVGGSCMGASGGGLFPFKRTTGANK